MLIYKPVIFNFCVAQFSFPFPSAYRPQLHLSLFVWLLCHAPQSKLWHVDMKRSLVIGSCQDVFKKRKSRGEKGVDGKKRTKVRENG